VLRSAWDGLLENGWVYEQQRPSKESLFRGNAPHLDRLPSGGQFCGWPTHEGSGCVSGLESHSNGGLPRCLESQHDILGSIATVASIFTKQEPVVEASSKASGWHDLRGQDRVGVHHLKLGARYYNPTTGRFSQPDPSGREANIYNYTACNPVNSSDPTGLATCDTTPGFLVGLIVIGGLFAAPLTGGESAIIGGIFLVSVFTTDQTC
jgi:RHS repeat-associated protein